MVPEDLHLVPSALFRGNLNWELPQPAETNLHVVIKLTDDPNELLEDFYDKIPQIDEVLRLWGEKKGASPTENRGWTSTREDEGTTLKRSSNLDTPGRADTVYLTDAVEDAKDLNVPSNLKTIDWSDFDGPNVHSEDVEPMMAVLPTEQSFNFGEHSMRNRTPSNLRVTEWLADKQYAEAHNSEHGTPRQSGPYETFWKNHDPYGPRLALATDEGESTSGTSQ